MKTTTFEEFTKKMLNEKFYQQAFKAYTDNEKFRSREAEINEKKTVSATGLKMKCMPRLWIFC